MSGKLAAALAALVIGWAGAAAAQSLPNPTVARIDSGRGDTPNALATDAAGNTYVAGQVDDRSRKTQFAVIKYSPQGNLVWRSHDDGALGGPVGAARSVAADSQGQVYATGYVLTTVGITSTLQNILAAFDANGRQLWSRPVPGGVRVRVDAADRVIVSGGDTTSQFSTSGELIWTRSEPGLFVTEMRLDAAGGPVVVGRGPAKPVFNANDIVVVRYDAQGNRVLRAAYSESDRSFQFPQGLAVAADGNIYVTGISAVDTSGEVPEPPVLLKVDSGGAVRVIGIGAQFGGSDVAVGADGDVTASGLEFVSRFDSAGNLKWTVSSGGLSVLALSANGDAFVSSGLTANRITAAGRAQTPVTFTDPGRPLVRNPSLLVTPQGVLTAAASSAASVLSTASDILTLRYVAGGAPTLPAAPSNLSASARQGAVTLRWTDNASNENGFSIERCAPANCTSFTPVGSAGANATSFVDTDVLRGVTYRYRVRAHNGGGFSAPSNIDDVRVK